MKFSELKKGQTFDFISGTHYDSFFLACMKTGPRSYVDSTGTPHKVGSIKVAVFHVNRNF